MLHYIKFTLKFFKIYSTECYSKMYHWQLVRVGEANGSGVDYVASHDYTDDEDNRGHIIVSVYF